MSLLFSSNGYTICCTYNWSIAMLQEWLMLDVHNSRQKILRKKKTKKPCKFKHATLAQIQLLILDNNLDLNHDKIVLTD